MRSTPDLSPITIVLYAKNESCHHGIIVISNGVYRSSDDVPTCL